MNLVSLNDACQELFIHDLHGKVGGYTPEYLQQEKSYPF